MTRDVPPRWASLLELAGLTDPKSGLPSIARLAEESGVLPSTISAMMYAERRTRSDTVEKVATTVGRLVGGTDGVKRARDVRLLVNESLR